MAALFGWILAVEQVPQEITEGFSRSRRIRSLLLLIVNVLLLIVGMFLDTTTAILVIVPIIAKPLVAAGVDPVHLGMVVVFNLMIGPVTPPMGLALFLVSDIARHLDGATCSGRCAILRAAARHARADTCSRR